MIKRTDDLARLRRALGRSRVVALLGPRQCGKTNGLSLHDVGTSRQQRHWLRGGFPLSYVARSEAQSVVWRREFIRSFLERDLPQMGSNVSSVSLRRFWNMLAHYHGQIWNAAELARSLGVNESTTRRYLDLLAGVFMVRQVQPWFENLGKRQIKSPKIYIRDSGLLHSLLGIGSARELEHHPKVGASWEGYAIEEVLRSHDIACFVLARSAGRSPCPLPLLTRGIRAHRLSSSLPGYAQHRPESTLLYQLVEQHYPAFREMRAMAGRSLPDYIEDEFDAYLKCGRLEEGFLRVRCEHCHAEKLVAFSCKKRGFCPSCGARRMAETAALLADEVLPERPLRQWVLSLPIALRFLLATDPDALTLVLGAAYRTISGYLLQMAGASPAPRGDTGAVTLIQRFGSALNLNVHFHMIFLDGVYLPEAMAPVFRHVPAPTRRQLQELVQQIAERIGRLLEKRGLIERDMENAWLAATGQAVRWMT
jgi:ribosomal protein S27E